MKEACVQKKGCTVPAMLHIRATSLKLSRREIVEQSLESQNFETMTALTKQLAVTHNNSLVTLIPN